ncbi:glutamate-gated chloride channel-like isoform X2 [Stegodyphus dumicola]|nr:glutamate-gated chloride channel-like isoform X2 [Stegodyphus dumicola]
MVLRTRVLLLILLLFCYSAQSGTSSFAERKIILDSIFRDYDLRIRPDGKNGTNPVVVRVNMYVRRISNIDESKMEYETQLTFRQSWIDDRLKYDNKNKFPYLTMNLPHKIWKPDVFFSNEKSGEFHNIIVPNNFIRIYPDGNVLYSVRISLKLSSPTDLAHFPFDKQMRSIVFASYGYTTKDFVFLWKRINPVQVTKNLHLTKFTLNSVFTDYCTAKTNTGQYSCLNVVFHFSRNLTYYLVRVYMPTAALVLLSFVTFWLHSQLTKVRLSLWMSSFICFFIVSTSTRNVVPISSSTTALDIWMGMCVSFMFGVLLELSLVIHMNEKCEESNISSEQIAEEKTVNGLLRFIVLSLQWFNKYSTKGQRTDAIARVLFPSVFALFNFIYWLTYAT